MLLIASSDSSALGRKSINESQGQKLSALKGIKYDVERFKKKFAQKNFHYIETNNNTLLPKKYILNWLIKHFENGLY